MAVNSVHPDYKAFVTQREKILLCIKGQDAIKAAGERFLPATTGMKRHWDTVGEQMYKGYKNRARFYGLTRNALESAIGILFGDNQDTELNDSQPIVTNDGLTTQQLAPEIAREAMTGRSIMVIDAPITGGEPYIVKYSGDALINWRVSANNPNKLSLAVLREYIPTDAEDEFSHETDEQYRVYRDNDGAVTVQLYRSAKNSVGSIAIEAVSEQITLGGVSQIPVVIVNAIDCTPIIYPAMLNDIADCMISAYQSSAEYEYAKYMSAHPTLWTKGITQEQYDSNCTQGVGSGSFWYLGDGTEGAAGYIEISGVGLDHLERGVQTELRQAEYYASRITQTGNGVESAQALQIRDDSQKANIYALAASVVNGISAALKLLSDWSNRQMPEFKLDIELSSETPNPSLLQSLTSGVTSGIIAQSVLNNYLRECRLTKKTDEELQAEIEQGGVNGLVAGLAQTA